MGVDVRVGGVYEVVFVPVDDLSGRYRQVALQVAQPLLEVAALLMAVALAPWRS